MSGRATTVRRWVGVVLAASVASCSRGPPEAPVVDGAPEPTVALRPGWRAAIAADARGLEALLDESPGWAALLGERWHEAAAAFRVQVADAGLPAGTRENARVGLARADLAAAAELAAAARVVAVTTQRVLEGAAPTSEAARWRTHVAALAPARAEAAPAALGTPATCAAEGAPPDEPTRRARIVACAREGRPAEGLALAAGITWDEPDARVVLSASDAGPAAEPTPVFDPALALAVAHLHRLEARDAACAPPATPAKSALCGEAAAALGDEADARAAFGALGTPDIVALLPALLFGDTDGPEDLREGVAAWLGGATGNDRAGAWACTTRVRGPACEPGALEPVQADLLARRRAFASWMATLPEPGRGLLRDLDAADSLLRAETRLRAEAFLRAGRPVEAFALLVQAGRPPGDGGRPPGGGADRALLVEAAVATDNAQVAYETAGALAAHHPSWSPARSMIQLWGLGRRSVAGGPKPG